MKKPVAAAIVGMALGGGLELAMACDFRIAARDAQFGQTEINVGLIPGKGGTQRLPRLIGMTRAAEMVLTGRLINAEEALEFGLVNRVVDTAQVVEEARKLLLSVAAKSPQSVHMAKLMLHHGQDVHLDTALMLESLAFAGMFSTDDMHEGVQAFLDKRKPSYQGR
jgi:enoyl-CoA hydratase